MPQNPPGKGTAEFGRRMAVSMRRSAVFAVAVLIAGVLIGYLARGLPGLAGGALGGVVGLAFAGITAVVAYATRTASDALAASVTLGAWLAKMIALFVVALAVRSTAGIDRTTFVIVLVIVVLGMLGIETGTLLRGRIPLDVSEPHDEDE